MEQLVMVVMLLALGGLLAYGRRSGPVVPEEPQHKEPPPLPTAFDPLAEPPPQLDRVETAPVENAWRLKSTKRVLAEKGRAKEPEIEIPPAPQEEPEPEPEQIENRRRHERLPSDESITVTAFGGRQQMAVACDVSLGGLRFRVVGEPPRQSDLLRLGFNVSEETIEAVGRVVRVKTLDPITHEVAVEFARIDPWAMRLLERALSEK